MSHQDNPFTHLTVLSLEQATTLPFLTMRLVQEGMRVIRLEDPGQGDPNRHVGMNVLGEPGMNTHYLAHNLGKEAITLDLSGAEGRAILHDLIVRLPVDIFACNVRPRSYAKLGIDYETLRNLRPELIWLGITGFGPQSDEAAYDPVLQARSGMMALTGEEDGPPLVFGLPVVDLGAAEHAYGQVMKALYQRQLTGQGCRLDIAMFQSAVSWLTTAILLAKSFGQTVTRHGNRHLFFAPVSVYPTHDGYVYIAVGNDRQWQAIVRLPAFAALDREEYARNAGRIAAVEQLDGEIGEITRKMTTAEVVAWFTEIGVPVSAVRTVEQVVDDPLVRDRLVWAQDPRTGARIWVAPPPVETPFLAAAGRQLAFPPRQGEHNQRYLNLSGKSVA